jgi:glyoxylase I family protein
VLVGGVTVRSKAVLRLLVRGAGRVPEITGVHHISLTVRDLSRSRSWYGDLLGLTDLFEGGDDDVSYATFVHPSSQLVLGLREYRDGSGDRFDEFHTGMDHLAFAVSSQAELTAWVARLEELGIEHSPIAETPVGQVLTLRDPDNIQLEFFAGPET